MADALVSAAGKKLSKVVGQQLSQFACATRDLRKLSSTFEIIKAVLHDAESRQASDESVKLWLSRLRHVAYDIGDLLEDGQMSGLGDEDGDEDDGNCINKLCLCFPLPHNPWDYAVSRCEIACDIKKIRERLDEIADDKNKYGFGSNTQDGDHSMLVRSQRQTTSLVDESEIIGRENDKETMISRLVSGRSSDEDRGHVQVVSIFGVGGLGKTTLAQLLYHDDKVRCHFNQDLYWVCVSEPFDVLRLTMDIIEEVRGARPTCSGLNRLQEELLQLLRGKRYLLVLDDVWNDDADKWEMLRLSLTSGANGSRILVTTRSEKVANTMNANYIHELKGLSDDQSWTLFSRRAFAGRGDCSEFESTGKEIVKKCEGVPLSIKVTGIFMYTKKTVEDWKNVLESKIWSLRQVADKILPALLLTYCNLPARLKQCFAYCSVFPKDWEYEKDVLVKLWVAQGFIQSDGNREKEDIGDEYFDELVARSMFQEIEEDYKGKITCKMHDLLHDLAEFIAKDEIYTFISNSEGGKSEECSGSRSDVRHAYLYFSRSDDKPRQIPIAARRVKKLRTLWLDGIDESDRLDGIDESDSGIIDLVLEARFLRALYFPSCTRLPKSIGKLKHLTYLCLPGSKIVKLPDAIGKMQQLRYLDLSDNSNIVELPESVSNLCKLRTLNLSDCVKLEKLPTGIGRMVSLRYLDLYRSDIVELPESVSDLRNLHTLNLDYCCGLKKLPGGICRMVNLRHLKIEGTNWLDYLPKGLGRISGLRSISKFIVGGGDEGCGIDELQPLNSLQGSLYIKHLVRVASREEAEKAELWKKQHLRRLDLTWSYVWHVDADTGTIDGVLEGLRPHENLEELTLCGMNGSKLPSWMDGMRRLLKLRLSSKLILDRLPHLTSLKELDIFGLKNEILPGEGWEQLVALEKLIFTKCRKLKCLPEGLGQLKKLNSLRVFMLRVLRCLPDSVGDLESLESLQIELCKKLESLPDSLGQLKKLNKLNVSYSEVLTCLPDSVGQLESLERLEINSLMKLESLPDSLEQLKSLNELRIYYCDALASLPQGLRHLSLLQTLVIGGCPLLTERCKREGGADWPNISHIPYTSIVASVPSDWDLYSEYAKFRALGIAPPFDESSEEEEATGAALLDNDAHEGSEEEASGCLLMMMHMKAWWRWLQIRISVWSRPSTERPAQD